MLPMQQGDVEKTFASTYELKNWIGYNPSTNLKDGVQKFVNWYLKFYGNKWFIKFLKTFSYQYNFKR